MKYRRFGKLDWNSSVLGFGAMRLPVIDGDPTRIDEPEAQQMIRYAIDHGVNYVDTAYPYHGGQSEPFVGRALQDGYREKVKLATKLPSWLVESPEDLDRYLNEQLTRLRTERIDFYLLHGLNKTHWPKLKEIDVFSWAEQALADGRIAHLGFSFHDQLPLFREIVDAYDNWTFCQIQYNYMDEDYQAGTTGLEYAAEQGLAIVVMEPIRGGRLCRNPPQPVQTLWRQAPRQRTPADWALQWVWHRPEVSVVLSGMSTMNDVVENIASADVSAPGTLSSEELVLIGQVRDEYRKRTPVPCTNCQYCMPCPNGINIPRIFEIYNDAVLYEETRTARFLYRGPTGLKPEQRADRCTECKECEDLCPQNIPITQWLKEVHQLLGARK